MFKNPCQLNGEGSAHSGTAPSPSHNIFESKSGFPHPHVTDFKRLFLFFDKRILVVKFPESFGLIGVALPPLVPNHTLDLHPTNRRSSKLSKVTTDRSWKQDSEILSCKFIRRTLKCPWG